jgi:hypothetical protein
MPLWLAQRWPQRQGHQEWIVVIRLALLHCQQLGLLLPVAGEGATSGNGAVNGEGHNATYGPPAVLGNAAIHHRRAPQLGGNRASIVACLVNTMVNIVGTNTNNMGRNCPFHNCCGMQLQVGSKVCFRRERLIYHEGQEVDELTVYIVGDCTMTCKIGFLPHHLAVRADAYDGLYARIISVYSNHCTNVLKREKFWRNRGCCVARVLGDRVKHYRGTL